MGLSSKYVKMIFLCWYDSLAIFFYINILDLMIQCLKGVKKKKGNIFYRQMHLGVCVCGGGGWQNLQKIKKKMSKNDEFLVLLISIWRIFSKM